MADYLPPVVAKLEGDIGGLSRKLTEGLAKVRKFAVDAGKVKAVISVEAKLKDGTLTELRRRVADSPAAKLKVDLQLGAGQREALQRSLSDRGIEVKVKPVMDAAAQRRVEIVLRELGKRIDVQIRPVMDQEAQVRAEQRLARLTRDRTVVVRTRVIGGGTPAGSGRGNSGGGALAAVLPFAPALTSVAASAASVVASVTAAAAAVGVFGAAAYSQVKQLGGLASAYDTLSAMQASNAKLTKKAAEEEQKALSTLEAAPPATQRAAAAYGSLRDTFKTWSDANAKFTMTPVLHSFVLAEGILPKLTPMVKGVSGELDRLVTVAAGEMNTPGFDNLMTRFTAFADGALHRGVDDVIHFARVLGEGGGGRGAVAQFMAYAKAEGPQVRETLTNIAKAISTIIRGSAEAGPGMLTVVNAVAKLVAALPPEFVGRAMQVYAALRLYKLASSGITSVAGSVSTLSGRLTVLRATSAAAGGGVAGVRAAIASLSTGAKIGGALAVIAGVALALHELGDSSKAAPDVDKMTTALGEFGRTGAVTGVLKGDLKDLSESIAMVSKSASDNKLVKMASDFGTWVGIAKGPGVSDAKKNVDSLDKSLASLVQGGHADLAAAASARLERAWIAGGGTAKRYVATMDDYSAAMADVKFSNDLAAKSEGPFGAQAQAVQKKLDAQKQAAQGLQQAILDLNDANRAALDAESAYQQAIDDATKAIKGHGHALTMTNGELNLNSQKARDAYGALSQLAATAEAASVATLQQTDSQEKANRVLIDAHARLVATAEKMGLNSQKARQLADSLDNIHDPKIQVTVSTMQAEANLASAKRKVDAFPKATRTTGNFAYQKALSDLQFFQRQVDMLHGKTVTVTINGVKTGVNAAKYYSQGPHAAAGAMLAGGVRRMAEGGMGRPAAMARGGTNVLWAEGGDESYIPHDRRPRSRQIAEKTVAIMGGSVSWGGAGGGSLSGAAAPLGAQVAAGLWAGMDSKSAWLAAQSKAFALRTIPQPMAEALGINSPSKVAASLTRWVGAGMVQGLTGSTPSVKAATLKLSRAIEQVFHDDAARQLAADKRSLANLAGSKGAKAARQRADLRVDMRQQQRYLSEDSSISRFVARDNARLLKLAGERDSVASKLKGAQSKLAGLQRAWADEKSQVASGIMQGAGVVTSAPQSGFALTGQDVVNNLKDQAAKAAQFAAELEALKKKGLRADLIDQIAAAGVDQGGATAAALAGASKATISQANSIQKGLTATANATGKVVADAMYGAGIKSAQGLVRGLRSQEKAIDAQMLRIAKSMEKAIREALGIHSPSRVTTRLGEYTGEGYALGLDHSVKRVRIAAQGMAMASLQGATLTGGGYHGGGGTHYHFHTTVNVAGHVTTERGLLDAIETGLSKRAGRNPGGLRPANPWNGRN